MNSKKGASVIILNVIVTFAIITLLISFVIFSTGIRNLDNVRGEVNIDDEGEVGLLEIYNYMLFFKEKVESRKLSKLEGFEDEK